VAAADLAARDLVDGVRGVAARRLAAGGAQTGGEPRAAPRGGDAEAHAQAGLVVVFHGLALALAGRARWEPVAASGRADGREVRIRRLGLWERKRHGRCGEHGGYGGYGRRGQKSTGSVSTAVHTKVAALHEGGQAARPRPAG